MSRSSLSLVHASDVPAGDADDVSYIAGVQRGDARVFTALVRMHLDALTRFAYSYVGDEDAAHDIVQDVFARVWQLGSEWTPRSSVRAYLFVAVRQQAANVLRNARTRQRTHARLQADARVTGGDPYADVLLGQSLHKEFQTLTDRQRDALRLRYGQQQSMSEVATVLGIDVRAAERLVSRALAALRTRLVRVQREVDQE